MSGRMRPSARRMSPARRRAGLAAVCLVLQVAAGATSCRDATGSRDRRILWFHADPTGAAAEPYADSALAVFTSFNDMRVVALDARTGALRWQQRLPSAPGAPYSGMPTFGNVTAFQDLIIVPAWDLYGLDRTTGAVRWKFQPPDDFAGYGNAFVADGRVYSVGQYLYALDAATGALAWRVDLGERPYRPVIADRVLYVATRGEVSPGIVGDGHAVALDASTGAVLWRFPIRDPQTPVNGGSVGPAFVADSLVLFAGVNGSVYALDRRTGEVRWTYVSADSYEAGLTIVDKTVVVAGDAGSVQGLDLATGRLLWNTDRGTSVFKRITAGPGVAFIPTGILFAYDQSGTLRWQDGGAGFGGPVYSTAATYRDGVVYIGSVGPEAPGAGFYALRVP
jgi:outer membrane protein assembly factor BamB